MNDYTSIILDYKKIGEKIRIEREKFKLTREALAEKINISLTYIGQIERGDRKMRFETYLKFARFFHVSTDYLLAIEQTTDTTSDEKSSEKINEIVDLLKRCDTDELDAIKSIILSLLPIIHK